MFLILNKVLLPGILKQFPSYLGLKFAVGSQLMFFFNILTLLSLNNYLIKRKVCGVKYDFNITDEISF